MPKALALVWEIIKDENISGRDKKDIILDFDRVFGLELDKTEKVEIPENVENLLKEREKARNAKDFAKSDQIRKEIEQLGYEVKDTNKGQIVNLG